MSHTLTSSNRLFSVKQYNESALVALLKEGNRKAFEELHSRFAPTLLSKLRHLIADLQQAEDVLQDSFVNIWLNFHQYDPIKGRLFTWMWRIVQNRALTELRSPGLSHLQLEDLPVEELGSDTPSYHWIGVDHWIRSALTPHLSHLIQLMYYQGYTYQEASDELGYPIGTVKTRVRQALRQLRTSEPAIATKQG